jgi:glycosyltransferase involved in cell wall biosynthesis
VCERFATRFPSIVRYKYNDINLGMQCNLVETYERCTGKYVAVLEGDDEWIDREKLRKQVEILENDSSVALCFSNALVNDIHNPAIKSYFSPGKQPRQRANAYAAVEHLVVPTCTIVFRNGLLKLPEWFLRVCYTDKFLCYLLSKFGDLCYCDEPLALYNNHYHGMSRRTNVSHMLFNDALMHYELIHHFDGDPRMTKLVVEKNIAAVNNLFHRRDFGLAIRLFWTLPLQRLVIDRRFGPMIAKLFLKTHLFLFLSKNEKRNIY